MFEDINWIQIIFSVLSGGAVGALISQYCNYRYNKKQPIEISIDLKPFFYNDATESIVVGLPLYGEGPIISPLKNKELFFDNSSMLY